MSASAAAHARMYAPRSPDKAIIVQANIVHIKIDKNAKQADEKLKEKKNVINKNDDFPF